MASLLLFTLLCVSTIILSLAENIRIDCGVSETYTDSDKLEWHGDRDFVSTGESFELPTKVPRPFKTCRYFPSLQKLENCYKNIPAKKGGKTLVRTRFFYVKNGTKSSMASFNVMYDEKYIVNVVLPDAKPSLFTSEVILSPKSEKISVCLLRTSSLNAPFISSIEVYNLDAGMYDGLASDEGLILRKRSAFGANEFIIYPSDPYGRQWNPHNNSNFNKLKTSASSIDITAASNKPPEIVLSKALSASNLKFNLGLPLTGLPVYLALYFSEPQRLNRTQRRSFNVLLDDKQINSVPIVPVFGEAIQVIEKNVMVTSKSQVTFQLTKDSNLPPLINAFELYAISNGQVVGGNVDSGKKELSDLDLDPEPDSFDKEKKEKNAEKARKAFSSGGKSKWQKVKLPVIIGTSSATALGLASFVVWKKSSKTKPHESKTLPTTSTVSGASPLIGQQLKSDAKHQEPNESGKV